MTIRFLYCWLFLSLTVVQPALAEPSGDALVGEWKSVPSDSKRSPLKQPDFETTLSVRENHKFVMRRKVPKQYVTTVYTGTISEIEGKVIATVLFGPVVCGSTAPYRAWTVSIEKDMLTVNYSEKNSESFVRTPKQENQHGESGPRD